MSATEDSVEVTTTGGVTKITYRAADYTEKTKVEATYTTPDGATETVTLYASAAGVFSGDIETGESGIYNLSVRRTEDGEIANALTTAAVVQYSDEYKFALSSDAYQAFINQYGKEITASDNIWTKLKTQAASKLELTKWLIVFAILWFVLEKDKNCKKTHALNKQAWVLSKLL